MEIERRQHYLVLYQRHAVEVSRYSDCLSYLGELWNRYYGSFSRLILQLFLFFLLLPFISFLHHFFPGPLRKISSVVDFFIQLCNLSHKLQVLHKELPLSLDTLLSFLFLFLFKPPLHFLSVSEELYFELFFVFLLSLLLFHLIEGRVRIKSHTNLRVLKWNLFFQS